MAGDPPPGIPLRALLHEYAEFEKRAMELYRRLGQRFPEAPAAARLWLEMSNTEASHFALLQLTQDWVALAGTGADAPVAAGSRGDAAGRLAAIEVEAARRGLTVAEAAALTVAWEEMELPRIVELVGHLTGHARGRVMAGLIAEAAEHFRILGELVEVAGAPQLAARAGALAGAARAAIA